MMTKGGLLEGNQWKGRGKWSVMEENMIEVHYVYVCMYVCMNIAS
jgi:hypothetical protein